jgi:hypothetical protein
MSLSWDKHNCANIYATAIGRIEDEGAVILADALNNAQKILRPDDYQPKIAPAQFFYDELIDLAEDAFVNTGVPQKNSEGYANLISHGFLAILRTTLSKIFNPLMQVGNQGDPPIAGTVWGTIAAAMQKAQQRVQYAKQILKNDNGAEPPMPTPQPHPWNPSRRLI